MKILLLFGSFFVSYFFAGIPFGYITGRIKGIDIRKYGSGNIGATNVFRVLGKKEGIMVFILDFLKGVIPVLFFRRYGVYFGILSFIGVFLGHTFTPYLGFKGGKGIATGFGGSIALLPLTSLFILFIWILVFILSGFVSLASISSAFFRF
jgi:glycerol-3-phosphate acyltransferase PlsY